MISRSAGRSATAAAAYRSAELIHDRRTGDDHDYRRRRGVEHCEIMLPAGAPEELLEREALWNAAEEAERRKNARVAREVLISMPGEFDQAEQRVGVTKAMAQWLVDHYGVGADLAVHAPDRQGSERNYHAHILITTRALDQDGFGAKTRALDDKTMGPEEIERIRQQWELIGNRHLELAGHEPSLDRRSLKDRGIDREAQPKLGPVATEMERAGRRSNAGDDLRAVKRRNAELERLKAERKVIDLAIERAKRLEQSMEPSQTRAQRREDRNPELSPDRFRNTVQDRQNAERGEFYQRRQARQSRLEQVLDRQHGDVQRQARADLDQLQATRDQRSGVAAWWASLTGRAERESAQMVAHQAMLNSIADRQKEARDRLHRELEQERLALQSRHMQEWQKTEERISVYEVQAVPQQRAVNGPEPAMRTTPEPQQETAEEQGFEADYGDYEGGSDLDQNQGDLGEGHGDFGHDMGDDSPDMGR